MSVYKLETKEKPRSEKNKSLKSQFLNLVLNDRWGHVMKVNLQTKTVGSYQLKSCIDEG